jgi:predicted phosphodiesterase
MRLGLLTDIHEDIVNLKKSLHLLEKQKCDHIACLGDIIGFCEPYISYVQKRNGSECLKLIRENCSYIVTGNHDMNCIHRLPVYRGSFKFPGNWYDMPLDERRYISEKKVWLYEDELQTELNDADREFIASLPEYFVVQNTDYNILLSHFIHPDITGSETSFPKRKQEIDEHLEFLILNECSFGFCGHVHVDGILVGHESRNHVFTFLADPFDHMPMGRYRLKRKLQCIGVPPVVVTDRRGGVSIFDTKDLSLSVLHLIG